MKPESNAEQAPIRHDLAGYQFHNCLHLATALSHNSTLIVAYLEIPITCLDRDHRVMREVAHCLKARREPPLQTYLKTFPCLVKEDNVCGFRLDRPGLERVVIFSPEKIRKLLADSPENFTWNPPLA